MKLDEFSALLDLSPEPAFALVAGDYRVLAANRAFCRRIDSAHERLIGRPLGEILAEEAAATEDYLRACAASFDRLAGSLVFGAGERAVALRCEAERLGTVTKRGTLTVGALTPRRGAKAVILFRCQPDAASEEPLPSAHRPPPEEAMARLALSLEEQVAERTRALVAANERLTAEIAERRQAEAALRQAQKMEIVGQLTGGVAHDFNNLLTVIAGNLELLEQRTEDPRLLRIVRSAKRATGRGEQLTQQLLAFSRKQFLRPQSTDVNRLVRGMEELLRSSLGSMNELITVLADDLWPCLTDPNQLEIVLLNLTINARDAMPKGGRLTIETANTSLSPEDRPDEETADAGDYVLIAVGDTGTGIPPDIIDRVFEPFFTTKEAGKGSGLGLSQVYGFVKQSGGHIRLQSELGKGTRVALYFPRAALPAASRPDAARSESVAQKSVLAVEDDPDIRELAVTMLSALGYKVLAAPDGAAALRILEEDPSIDLLFTDIVMPGGLDGFAVARLALQSRPDIKILFTSGYAASAHTESRPAGGRLISKPYRPADLAREIEAVLSDGGRSGAGRYEA